MNITFPLNRVVAGPILRRSSADEVCIWLATSARPVSLSGAIYGPLSGNGLPPRLDDAGAVAKQCRTVCLGERLYVSLLRIKPQAGGFPRGVLLGYDITLDGKNLAQLGMTAGADSIVYPGMALPCFYLAQANNPTALLHGSCRKLHGEGEDALVAADLQIRDQLHDLSQRPAALFLTGDQIYADDVAGPLIQHLAQLGEELCPHEPSVPGFEGKLSRWGVSERGDAIARYARLTSGEADNHLVSFGDFAAMYTLAWSGWAWPGDFPSVLSAIPEQRGLDIARLELKRNRYKGECRRLLNAKQGLPAVRRALANIPTYMIFDDHEVTDDWNLRHDWFVEVQGEDNPSGRRIVANALAAYWAFQGWGNSPDDFSDDFIADIEGFLGTPSRDANAEARFISRMLSWNRWSYVAPTEPRALVLDTRTQRKLDDPEQLPWLIKEQALENLPQLVASGKWQGDMLLIVSAAPLLGMRPVETIQEVLDELGSSPEAADFEAWSANRHGMGEFLHALLEIPQLKHAVLLSGDVHYAFTSTGNFEAGGRKLKLTQLTSSAQKNVNSLASLLNEALDHLKPGWEICGWRGQRPRSLEQERVNELFRTNPLAAGLPARRLKVHRLLVKPESVVLTASEIGSLEVQGNPDWRLRCDYLPMGGNIVHKTNNLGRVVFEINGILHHHLLLVNKQGEYQKVGVRIA